MTPLLSALRAATDARKCHTCGCFHDAVAALESSALAPELGAALPDARATFGERRQDCLGCAVCWPADALNIASTLVDLPAGAGCPVEPVVAREGWPPLPGTYRVLRASAPVAVCTLHSPGLADALADRAPDGLAIVGPMQTENLGIERLVENLLANPAIRVLLLAGADTAGAVGHFPGQSLLALATDGVDERMRIRGASGRRPVLANLDPERVARFREQVRIVDHRDLADVALLAELIDAAAADAPGPLAGSLAPRGVPAVPARAPGPHVPDPAGYVVIHPDAPRRRLVAEHYGNDGVLRRVVAGSRATEVLATLLAEGACSRLDHAGYLGRELTRAEAALDGGPPYVQDRAPGSPIRAQAPVSSRLFSTSEAPMSSAPGRQGAPTLPPPSPDANKVASSNAAEDRAVRSGSPAETCSPACGCGPAPIGITLPRTAR